MNIGQLGNELNRFAMQPNSYEKRSTYEFDEKLENLMITKPRQTSAVILSDKESRDAYIHIPEKEMEGCEAYKRIQRGSIQETEGDNPNENSTDKEESEGGTDSCIVVRPDGSRVLQIKTKICGMESAMCIKISEPTDMEQSVTEQTADVEKTKQDV